MIQNWSNFQSRNVLIYGYVFHDTSGQKIMVKHRRPRGSPWTKFCTVTTCWSPVGKTVRRSSIGTWIGKKYRNGNVYLFIENKDYSHRKMWMTSKRLERSRVWLPCGKIWWNWLTLENQHHFLIMCIWDVLNVHVNRTKRLLTITERRSNHEFLLEQLKNCWSGKHSTQKLSRVPTTLEGHAKKCFERYGEVANKKTEQLCKVSTPCLDDPSFQGGTGNVWRTVQSMFADWPKMLVFGTNR